MIKFLSAAGIAIMASLVFSSTAMAATDAPGDSHANNCGSFQLTCTDQIAHLSPLIQTGGFDIHFGA